MYNNVPLSLLFIFFFSRLNYLELDSIQSMTQFYVVANLILSLLNLEHCRSSSEREHTLFEIVTNEKHREDLCLLNNLLATEVSFFFFRYEFYAVNIVPCQSCQA